MSRRPSTSASRNASLVLVLPTEPVTPITLAFVRARAAAARSRKAGQHIGHDQKRRVRRHCGAAIGGDDGERGFGRERRGDEFMPVAAIAVMAKNASPRRDGAAVDRNPGYGLRQRAMPFGTHRRRHLPRRSTAGGRSCGKLLERRGDRLMIAERHNSVADDLAGFMALAGDQQDVAGTQLGDRRADRLAAVADLDGAAARRP